MLILKQPDFGSTVMIALILFAMLFAAGARGAHLAGAGGGALVHAGVSGGGEIVSDEAADDVPRSVVGRARRRISD